MTILDDASLYTVGWIAALPIERAAATALLDERHEIPHGFEQHQSDTNAYTWGRVGEHNIVIASLPAGVYGTTSAATTALNLLSSMPQIRVGLLVGIGGAVARPDEGRDIRLGDVVVSQPEGTEGGVVQYDLGKATSNHSWERKGSLNMPPPVLLHALANLQAEHEISPSKVPDLLHGMWTANPQMTRPKANAPAYVHQGFDNDRLFISTYNHAGGGTCKMCDMSKEVQRNQRDTTDPYIHYGVIASGNSLIKDAAARDRIADGLGEKCVCFEMEAAGLMNHFPCLVIRGICDYADSHKNDRWQRYASAAAAAFAKELLGFVPAKQVQATRRAIDTLNSICENMENIQSATVKVSAGVQAVHAIVSHINERYKDDIDRKCMRNLYETDPREDKKRIQEAKGFLLKDCYRWILDHADFQRFCDDPRSRLLWVKGDPGKGKTMLLCGIIDELERRAKHLVCYFFCQATETQLSSAVSVLRGLLYLLVDRQRSLISYVRSKHAVTGDKLFQGRNTWFSLVEMLREMLQDPALKGAVFIVDALDECTERGQLLDFIQSISPSHVKWIISSRNWLDIEEKLDSMKQKVTLHLELNKESVSKAVTTYIGHKVEELTGLKNYDNETKEAVRRHLFANSDGTFLWVALVCKELADTSIIRKQHTLSKLKSFPPGLDHLYGRMMEHISGSHDANICKDILATASVVKRPVTLDELKVLVESLKEEDHTDLPRIITSCGSFLSLRGGVIYFVHQSARDFLLKKAYNKVLPLGAAHQHYAIFTRSLKALSRLLRRDIYNLGAPGFPSDQISLPKPDPLASIRYSCLYWVDHLAACERRGTMGDKALQDGSVVHEFIEKKYLNWLESLGLIRSTSAGVLAMQKLETLVRNTKAPGLTALIQDARRFILAHRRVIEIAPLQVYASALVFSPTRSLIRGLFQKQEPDWMVLKPHMESTWNACLQTLEIGCFVQSVAFAPDDQLVSNSSDNAIKMWDAATGACVQTLKGHSDSVDSVAFSADGLRLASSSSDKTIKVWDARTGACMRTLKSHGSVDSVALSTDGRRLASDSYNNTIKVWDVATGACVQTLRGHDDWVMSVAFSTDGQRLASGSYDDTIKVWDVATGACVQTLKGHDRYVMSVTFSMDDQRLASGSSDKTIKVWNATTGACMRTLRGHDDWVMSVSFSTDGQRLASGSRDNTIKVWDAATGACTRTLKGHGNEVMSVTFSTDGQRLASGSSDNTIKVWDATMTGTGVETLQGGNGSVRSVAFSIDGQRLASGLGDTTVKVWDAATGSCMRTLKGHDGWVKSVAFSTDGQRLASGSDDDMIKVWDAVTGACVQTLKGHGGHVTCVIFSTDGRRLASCSDDFTVKIWDAQTGASSGWPDETIKLWDATTGAFVQTLKGHRGSVTSVAFSTDGRRLASSSFDDTVKVWDAKTGACMRTLKGHGSWVMSVAFSTDGQRLASGSYDDTIKVWDAATGACAQTLKGHGDHVTCVVFSADGRRLASGSCDKTIKLWKATTGSSVETLKGHDSWVKSAAFTTDGQRLASGSRDKTVKVWDAATGACMRTLRGHDGWVLSVAFSTDGHVLASGSTDKTIKVWDAATGACTLTLEGHGGHVTCVIFSTDGRRLASCSHDLTVKIWDAQTGACMRTLKGHGSWVMSVAFSNDGRRLASGSSDNTIKVWDVATGACVQTLKGHGGHVTSVVFSTNGQQLASSSFDKTIKVWNVGTGTCVRTFKVGRQRQLTLLSIDQTVLSTCSGVLNLDLWTLLPTTRPSADAIGDVRHSGWGIDLDGDGLKISSCADVVFGINLGRGQYTVVQTIGVLRKETIENHIFDGETFMTAVTTAIAGLTSDKFVTVVRDLPSTVGRLGYYVQPLIIAQSPAPHQALNEDNIHKLARRKLLPAHLQSGDTMCIRLEKKWDGRTTIQPWQRSASYSYISSLRSVFSLHNETGKYSQSS
ncbi:hypothetical protein Purlil1_13701 [Purpureocillium lilacinum]|uniref:NACHT domain-containing protein n=1 Tax=Purpureocillium lilacinum TaxID=33203 RepID=A0ABR0BDA8_PURLI|nr:hypothetical protein Purlil1_13701 [Purpureocillium lilacinum]